MTAKIFSLASFLSFCCCKDHTFLVWPEKILKKWLQPTEIFFFCSFCHSFVISSFSALWISRQIIPSYWLFFEYFFSLPKSSLPAVLSIIKKWADFKMTEALLDQLWRWNGSTNLFFFFRFEDHYSFTTKLLQVSFLQEQTSGNPNFTSKIDNWPEVWFWSTTKKDDKTFKKTKRIVRKKKKVDEGLLR